MSAESHLALAIVHYCNHLNDWEIIDDVTILLRHKSGVTLVHYDFGVTLVKKPLPIRFGWWNHRKVNKAVQELVCRLTQSAFFIKPK